MGNPNRRPTASSRSLEQKCLHRSGNSRGWTYSDLHIQQEYAAWIRTPFKKAQSRNGNNTAVQQQVSRMDEPQDWTDEVSTAAQSDCEQDWDGVGCGEKVEEKGGTSIERGESSLSFPAQSTVDLSESLKEEEVGNEERRGGGSVIWDSMGAGMSGSGLDSRQDEGAERDFNEGMKNIPEEHVNEDITVNGWGGDVKDSVW